MRPEEAVPLVEEHAVPDEPPQAEEAHIEEVVGMSGAEELQETATTGVPLAAGAREVPAVETTAPQHAEEPGPVQPAPQGDRLQAAQEPVEMTQAEAAQLGEALDPFFLEAGKSQVLEESQLLDAGESQVLDESQLLEAGASQSLQRRESLDDLLASETFDLPEGWEAVWSEEYEAHYFWHQPSDTVTWDPPDPVSPVRPSAFISVDSIATEVPHVEVADMGSATERRHGQAADMRATAPWARETDPVQFRGSRLSQPRFFIRPGLVNLEALNKIEDEKMDLRFRRDRINQKRREKCPIPSQVAYDQLNALQGAVFHRHIHHHVHYHKDEPQAPESQPLKAEAEEPELMEFRSMSRASRASMKHNSKGPTKSVAEILRPVAFYPVGAAGAGLRKVKSETKLRKSH